jgi:FkbM family methyltransferase
MKSPVDISNEVLERKILWLQERARKRIKGVLHVGAHVGQEAPVYTKIGCDKVIWIEAEPHIYERLKQAIKEFPNQTAHCCVASDVDGRRIKFYLTDDDGQSSSVLSLLPCTKRGEYSPMKLQAVVDLRTTRLDTLMREQKIDASSLNFLSVDVQGYELAVLRGLGNQLSNFDFLCCEVNLGRMYEKSTLFHQLDWYVTRMGFKRVWIAPSAIQGEALYIRSSLGHLRRLSSVSIAFLIELMYWSGLLAKLREQTSLMQRARKLYYQMKGHLWSPL